MTNYAQNEAVPTLLTVQQVAAIVQMSADYVYDEVKRGNLPATRLGKAIRITPSGLDAWIEANKLN